MIATQKQFVWFALILTLLPSSAYAHGNVTGVNDFYTGALHPFTAPLHILVLIALGILLGQHKLRRLTASIVPFAVCALIGLFASFTGKNLLLPDSILILLASAVGIFIVLSRLPSVVSSVVIFGMAAVALATDSGVENASSVFVAIKTLLGTFVCMITVVFTVGFYSSLLIKEWQKIGMRIVGSWVLAISILLLAFKLR